MCFSNCTLKIMPKINLALKRFLDVILLFWNVTDIVFHYQVQGHIKNLIEEHFTSDMEEVMSDPILFGDYREALRENELRLYEDLKDYLASKSLFQV